MSVDFTVFQQSFFQEATELLNDLETQLLHLEEQKDDRELLNTIFRCAHSIKGGSATFGFPEIAKFTHGLETLLDRVREGIVPVTGELCKVLFEALDQMRALLAQGMGTSTFVPDDADLTARILALSESGDGLISPGSTPVSPKASFSDSSPTSDNLTKDTASFRLHFAPGPDVMRTGGDPCLLLGQLARIADIDSVNRDSSSIPPLLEMDPEACYMSWDIDFKSEESEEIILEIFDFISDESDLRLETRAVEEVEATATLAIPAAGQPVAIPDAAPRPETTILRVPADKVDRLVNLVGELIITQSMLNEVTLDFQMDRKPRLLEAVAAMERASRELQERIMGIRLVQVKHALARFPRLVRDLSAAVDKKIDLVTVGEETELDKTLIEGLGDPLTHLIRNAIDHGMENPAERKAAGKPEHGCIKIISRYEGGNVIIEVTDDGRGLDRDRILAKARERGFISESDTPSDEAIFACIFHPGFSTAKAVTDLSGRGVGMDIVRQAIQGMNGSITLNTSPGVGTSFRIRLPLTMAIMEGLSLRVGKEVYILPLTSIVESLRPNAADLSLITGQYPVVSVRGEVLSILKLHDWFGIEGGITDPCEALLIIVENEGHKVALLVDELITQNQAVIKSLEANYRKVDGITGATILGDGQVALIIDVPGLLRGMHNERGTAMRAA